MAALKNMFTFEESQIQRESKLETVQLRLDVTTRYDVEVTRLILEMEGTSSLEKLRKMFKDDNIEECARSVLFSSKHLVDGNTFRLSFRLHKQAALMGKVHFSELHESPLGPINVDITTDEPIPFIDWFTPREKAPEKNTEMRGNASRRD